jgi:type I restriction enzyme S subunit
MKILKGLVSRSNTPELVGRAGRYKGAPEHAYYPDLMMRIRVNQDRVSPQFAELLLQNSAGKKWIKSRASGTSGSMVKIKRRDIMSFPVCLPERAEQDQIVLIISAAKNAIAASEEKLAALQEVKKSLLQNLLTGKIRIPATIDIPV